VRRGGELIRTKFYTRQRPPRPCNPTSKHPRSEILGMRGVPGELDVQAV